MRRCRWLASAAVLLSFAALPAATKPKEKVPERYRTWLNRDAVYIITDEEKNAFLKLDSDQARDVFIQEFWEIRNPLRGSKDNPYKDEIYRRIEHANAHFGRQSNTPGWMTDMGRTYIELGAPKSRFPLIGYGQIYPLELWFYANDTGNPSLPPFFYVLFYIPEDIGEYRFYRPAFDGPMKLVRGSRFRSNADVYHFLKPLGGDLAHAAFSLIPSEPIDTLDFTTSLQSDMLVAKIQNFANDPFNVRRIRQLHELKARVTSWFLVADAQRLQLNTLVLADPQGQYWLDFSVPIESEELGTPDRTGQKLAISLFYRLTTLAGDLIVDDTQEGMYPAFEGSGRSTFQPFQIAARIPLIPGDYKLEVQVANRTRSRAYRGESAVHAGSSLQKASISGPLIASSVHRVAVPDAMAPFEYFGIQFQPALARRASRHRPLYLLFQMEAPVSQGIRYDIEYVLVNLYDRNCRRTITDTVKTDTFQNGRLLQSKTLAATDLTAGEYRLVLNLRETGSPAVLSSVNVPLRLIDEPAGEALYIMPNGRQMGTPGVSAYIRALEAAAAKDNQAAVEYLRQAVAWNPANDFASHYLMLLYFNSRQFASAADLYRQLGLSRFKGSPEMLAVISLSFRNIGDRTQANEILQAARSYFPDNSVLKNMEQIFKLTAR